MKNGIYVPEIPTSDVLHMLLWGFIEKKMAPGHHFHFKFS